MIGGGKTFTVYTKSLNGVWSVFCNLRYSESGCEGPFSRGK